jgi:hypothetical protein
MVLTEEKMTIHRKVFIVSVSAIIVAACSSESRRPDPTEAASSTAALKSTSSARAGSLTVKIRTQRTGTLGASVNLYAQDCNFIGAVTSAYTPPLQYSWSGFGSSQTGSLSSYLVSLYGWSGSGGNVYLNVSDATGASGSTQVYVYVYPTYPTYPNVYICNNQ